MLNHFHFTGFNKYLISFIGVFMKLKSFHTDEEIVIVGYIAVKEKKNSPFDACSYLKSV